MVREQLGHPRVHLTDDQRRPRGAKAKRAGRRVFKTSRRHREPDSPFALVDRARHRGPLQPGLPLTSRASQFSETSLYTVLISKLQQMSIVSGR